MGFRAFLALLLPVHWVSAVFSCGSRDSGPRVVSVGDFHGDWEHSTERLTALGLLRNGTWSGADATLVVTGDIVDRGDYGKALWELMFKLQDEAAAAGGQVVLLLGNHELLLMMGDLTYVTNEDMSQYGGREGLLHAWSVSGPLGAMVRARGRTAALIKDVIFVHAGLVPGLLNVSSSEEAGSSVEDLNRAVADILLRSPATWFEPPALDLMGDTGPFWTRALALATDDVTCPLLVQSLRLVGAKRMVVGHTPQMDGGVFPRCDGRLLLADTLMSQAYTFDAAVSAHNEAAVEFYGDSSSANAVYPMRTGPGRCVPLLLQTGLEAPAQLRPPAPAWPGPLYFPAPNVRGAMKSFLWAPLVSFAEAQSEP